MGAFSLIQPYFWASVLFNSTVAISYLIGVSQHCSITTNSSDKSKYSFLPENLFDYHE
jgi:hypothetical protein